MSNVRKLEIVRGRGKSPYRIGVSQVSKSEAEQYRPLDFFEDGKPPKEWGAKSRLRALYVEGGVECHLLGFDFGSDDPPNMDTLFLYCHVFDWETQRREHPSELTAFAAVAITNGLYVPPPVKEVRFGPSILQGREDLALHVPTYMLPQYRHLFQRQATDGR